MPKQTVTLADDPETLYNPIVIVKRVKDRSLVPQWHIVLIERSRRNRKVYYTFCERIFYPVKHTKYRYIVVEYERVALTAIEAHKGYLLCQKCVDKYISFLQDAKSAARRVKRRLDREGYTVKTIGPGIVGQLREVERGVKRLQKEQEKENGE